MTSSAAAEEEKHKEEEEEDLAPIEPRYKDSPPASDRNGAHTHIHRMGRTHPRKYVW